jgi:hypothetical protein
MKNIPTNTTREEYINYLTTLRNYYYNINNEKMLNKVQEELTCHIEFNIKNKIKTKTKNI